MTYPPRAGDRGAGTVAAHAVVPADGGRAGQTGVASRAVSAAPSSELMEPSLEASVVRPPSGAGFDRVVSLLASASGGRGRIVGASVAVPPCGRAMTVSRSVRLHAPHAIDKATSSKARRTPAIGVLFDSTADHDDTQSQACHIPRSYTAKSFVAARE